MKDKKTNLILMGVIQVSLMREMNRKKVWIWINVQIVKITKIIIRVSQITKRIIMNFLSLETQAVVVPQVIRHLGVSQLLLQWIRVFFILLRIQLLTKKVWITNWTLRMSRIKCINSPKVQWYYIREARVLMKESSWWTV